MNFYYLKNCLVFINILSVLNVNGQTEKPFIRLVQPLKTDVQVSSAVQFISGSTCKSCSLSIQGLPVKVYPTGAFAFEINLQPGDSAINIISIMGAQQATKTIRYNYKPNEPSVALDSVAIGSIQTFPEGNLVLRAGDKIRFRVKAYPGSNLTTYRNTQLYELPATQNQIAGIYQGEYVIQQSDSFSAFKFPVRLITNEGRQINVNTTAGFSTLSPYSADIARTKGRLAFLEYGLGDDRLGGAKMSYLDSLIPLRITGKFGTDYRVQLSKNRSAYISEDLVTLMPKGSFINDALTGNINIYGDSIFDYVALQLSGKLPYESLQLTDPSRIEVDVFGATSNTNWITQLQSAKEVEYVDYRQVADDIFRLNIKLKNTQHWGHTLFYRGNTLVIRIRQQPKSLLLKDLVIGVDAGHGGSNTGGGGPTGSSEKNIALDISLKLQSALAREGAKVIMSRTKESFFDNKERILFYRDNLPDLLVSVHLNSSADPIHSAGTSTHYRYIGFKPLSSFIHKRMLGLGLPEYGNIGAFNFMLNSPTEYPNALVETLFLSNPEEEMKAMDPVFQQSIADAIVAGIKDFLSSLSANTKK